MFKKYWGGEQPYYRVTSPWIKTVYPECLIGDSSLEAVLEPDECWHWSASSQRGRYS